MEEVILQNLVFPDEICPEEEMYYRSRGNIEKKEKGVLSAPIEGVTTDAYMNVLDAGWLQRYTQVEQVLLELQVCGSGKLKVWSFDGERQRILQERKIRERKQGAGRKKQKLIFEIKLEKRQKFIWWEAITENDSGQKGDRQKEYRQESFGRCLEICGGKYFVRRNKSREVKLAVLVCTYQRKEAIKRLLATLQTSPFWKKQSAYYQKLELILVDNASELEKNSFAPEGYGDLWEIFPNRNEGGSGGFQRGMEELRKKQEKAGFTHCILMDDDALLQTESLIRLYGFLKLCRKEYGKAPVAGRMFQLDQSYLQLTAGEIWNGGYLRHVDSMLDMRSRENALKGSDEEGEYGGWWFCCYPVSWVQKEDPMPLFLHCDDVEYGLRYGIRPVSIPGVQVWHEAPGQRQTPIVGYYDCRNMAFVNELIRYPGGRKHLTRIWRDNLFTSSVQENRTRERLQLLGIWDYHKKMSWLKKQDPCITQKRVEKFAQDTWENKILYRLLRIWVYRVWLRSDKEDRKRLRKSDKDREWREG